MKKIVQIIMVMITVFTITGCNNKEEERDIQFYVDLIEEETDNMVNLDFSQPVSREDLVDGNYKNTWTFLAVEAYPMLDIVLQHLDECEEDTLCEIDGNYYRYILDDGVEVYSYEKNIQNTSYYNVNFSYIHLTGGKEDLEVEYAIEYFYYSPEDEDEIPEMSYKTYLYMDLKNEEGIQLTLHNGGAYNFTYMTEEMNVTYRYNGVETEVSFNAMELERESGFTYNITYEEIDVIYLFNEEEVMYIHSDFSDNYYLSNFDFWETIQQVDGEIILRDAQGEIIPLEDLQGMVFGGYVILSSVNLYQSEKPDWMIEIDNQLQPKVETERSYYEENIQEYIDYFESEIDIEEIIELAATTTFTFNQEDVDFVFEQFNNNPTE